MYSVKVFNRSQKELFFELGVYLDPITKKGTKINSYNKMSNE